MIPYTQSVASQEVPPPYHFPGVTVNAFVWEAHLDKVQAYCDRFFNLGEASDRGFVYGAAPIWPYAILLFIDYPVMISASPTPASVLHSVPYSDRGIVTQREVFIAIPVIRRGIGPRRLITDSALEWALPFIVVGEPMSAVCGREMLGLEKLRADIQIGESSFPESFRGQVSLPGWPRLEPTVMQQMMLFLDVDTGPAVPTFRGSPDTSSLWTMFRSRTAGDLIDSIATGADFIETLSAGTMPTSMQTVSLKQFRDAAEPNKAVHQSLVSCRSKYSQITNFQFYKEDDVHIRFYEEGSFGETLRFIELPPGRPGGDKSDASRSFSPKAAYRFNANIDFDNMRTLHTFAVDRGPGLAPTPAKGDLTAPWLRPWRGLFGGGQP
jgi:hypothetical protein